MTTTLTCRIKKFTCYVIGLEDIEEQEFETQLFEISTIHNMVTNKSRREMESYSSLVNSLSVQGMKDPIILIPNTLHNWEQAIRGVKADYLTTRNSSKTYIALTGNSRLTWAIDQKYEKIEGILVPTMAWMHSAQLWLQNGVIKHEV